MQLQFQKTQVPCLQQVKCQVQNLEQSQELRLDDTMPPVGTVVGAWGQVLLRSKEWRGGSVQVTGGVMAWVLYLPEDGGKCHSLDCWIPFQARMDIPQSERDGTLCVSALLRGVDARILNERKLMVRADVSLQLCAMAPGQAEVYTPDEMPEDVQLLKNTYPVCLPTEAGEKPFVIDEVLTLPGSCPPVDRLIHFCLQPELMDRKVMADKVVFRGCGILHILYLSADGQICGWDFELPFSQYAELSGQYGEDAQARIVPALTSLEVEKDPEGKLLVKAGLVGQYTIHERHRLQVVEDAYSTRRALTALQQPLQLPAVLDMDSQLIHCEQMAPAEGNRIVELSFLPEQPSQVRVDDGMELELAGRFQLLTCDPEGVPRTVTADWSQQQRVGAHDACRLSCFLLRSGMPQAVLSGTDAVMRADMLLDSVATVQQSINMLTGLELGEDLQQDDRPSVILRRAGGDSLWSIAKETGSSVEAIQNANGLEGEPAENQMLLIPTV